MKKSILTLLLFPFFLLLYGQEHCIVFVHIGNQLPHYMDSAISQARLFNEETDIFLIANERALKNYNREDIHLITCESLKRTTHHDYFNKNTTLNKTSREGFWKYATERFFYIDELAKEFNLKHIFHIESDNMVYVNFQDLLPTFKKHYPGIGAVFSCDDRCIPSIIYFSNIKAIDDLTCFMAKISKMGKSDMKSLAFYKDKMPKDKIDFLPSIFNEYIQDHGLKTFKNQKPKQDLVYCNHIREFNSIFDAQAIGYYLGGRDSRNGSSFPGQINVFSLFDPRLFTFKWIEDHQGRAIPYIIYKDAKYRINNIHVHSKNLKKFSSTDHELGEVVIKSTSKTHLYVP